MLSNIIDRRGGFSGFMKQKRVQSVKCKCKRKEQTGDGEKGEVKTT